MLCRLIEVYGLKEGAEIAKAEDLKCDRTLRAIRELVNGPESDIPSDSGLVKIRL
jgi:hypothetical protein